MNAPPPYLIEPSEILGLQDITSYRPSPVPGRAHTAPLMGSHAIGLHNSSKIHETSFSNAIATEQSVAKISAMFPTVSETHIRALLIKYMKSMFPKADETVILDTLYNVDNNVQAATTQLQAMGFDKKDSATPSCAGTPSGKIKDVGKVVKNEEKEKIISTPTSSARLRSVVEKQAIRDRLKKNHPDLAEQLISMALDSVDYDECRAGQILNMMIQEESSPKSSHPNSASSSQRPQSSKSDAEVSSLGTKTTVEADVAVPSNRKPDETKNSMKEDVSDPSNVKDTPNNDDKISASGKGGPANKTISTNATVHTPPNQPSTTNPTTLLPPTKTSLKKPRGKKDVPKVSRGTSTTEDKEYRSVYRFTPSGPNSSLHLGPNDELLIEDYVAWTGPRHHSEGRSGLAKGADKSLLSTHRHSAKGHNQEVCKGPQKGLAKGSMYSHLAACNGDSALAVVESRGK